MTTPRICVTVSAATMDHLVAERDRAAIEADLVELRLDGVREVDVPRALAGRLVPVVVTCRPRREGGAFDGPEDERLALLQTAARLGAEYVDVEFDSAFGPLVAGTGGRGVILSSHDFSGVPADLAGRVRAMRAVGTEVVKVAVMAHSLRDTAALLALGREATEPTRLVLVAMGTPGLPSRILAARFGSSWTYAGEGVAPGQVSPGRLLSEFRFRAISASTRLYGIIGRPVEHSVSPAMHNAAFEACGFDGVYLPLEASDAADAITFASAIGLAGASITAPYKLALLAEADEVNESARLCGAANTLRIDNGRRVVRNTDPAGFLEPLDHRGIALGDARVAVVGTGGAARAVVSALGQRHARVTVYGRRLAEAARVAAVGGGIGRGGDPEAGSWDLLVNATPVGTWPETSASPVPPESLRGGQVVYDLVYNPPRTSLLETAAAAGCRTIEGLEMLVAQAVAQFEWWTGMPAPRDVMWEAARDRLRQMAGTA
jgi:3-dehydroquinate dehydratase / shikimate dehydrogenase